MISWRSGSAEAAAAAEKEEEEADMTRRFGGGEYRRGFREEMGERLGFLRRSREGIRVLLGERRFAERSAISLRLRRTYEGRGGRERGGVLTVRIRS